MGIEVSIDAKGSLETLPYTVKINTYRIIQEALNNTIKHAGASSIKIQLHYRQCSLSVSIQDDGVGFANPTAHSTLGIISMYERAKLMGCELHILSNPDGTSISFEVQLNDEPTSYC